ncbi:MAG: 23S rRNA (guanosine(2251)-2'-O)-methyltransferase RlmB [Williamsia sp.]|nr:23S rRNA (guanosine(2251)-2'-O)-methyltransferase RlmB [Williamsia sp.]
MKANYRKQFRPKKSQLIAGRKRVFEAIAAGKHLERIYLDQLAHGEEINALKRAAADHLIPVNKVPVEKLNSFHVPDHEGCLALVAKIQYQDLQQVISFIVEQGKTPLFLILDGITDVRNIGAIGRTAYCCGVHGLIIPDKGVGAINEDAITTSAGALEKIAVCRTDSLPKAIEELHLNGIRVAASEMSAAKKLYELDLTEPFAIIMGSEDKGIQPNLLRIADEQFSIPMTGHFESLNVSVAAGMILYEAMKQRMFALP